MSDLEGSHFLGRKNIMELLSSSQTPKEVIEKNNWSRHLKISRWTYHEGMITAHFKETSTLIC